MEGPVDQAPGADAKTPPDLLEGIGTAQLPVHPGATQTGRLRVADQEDLVRVLAQSREGREKSRGERGVKLKKKE